jgi:hypothetical protein
LLFVGSPLSYLLLKGGGEREGGMVDVRKEEGGKRKSQEGGGKKGRGRWDIGEGRRRVGEGGREGSWMLSEGGGASSLLT